MTSPIKFPAPSTTRIQRPDLGPEGVEHQGRLEKKFGFGSDDFFSAEGKLYTEFRRVTGKKETEKGTTYVMQHQVKEGAAGSIQSKAAGFKVQADLHGGTRYQSDVTVPKGSDADPAKIDARKPDTMPEGSSVTMRKENFAGVELSGEKKLGVKGVGVDASVKLGLEAAQGHSVRVEKLTGNRVRVTEGPHEAVRAHVGAGLKAGGAEVALTLRSGAERSKLKQAEFDLKTAEGRNAYAQYQKTGKLPEDSWSIKEERVDGKVRLDLKGLGLGVGGEVPLFDATQRTTKHPDGSKMVETQGSARTYGPPMPMALEYRERRVYAPDGKEDVSKRHREISINGSKLHAEGEKQFDFRAHRREAEQFKQIDEWFQKNPDLLKPRQVPGNPYLIYA